MAYRGPMPASSPARRFSRGVAALILAVAVSGCGVDPAEPAAVARDFYRSLGQGQFEQACSMVDQDLRVTLGAVGDTSCETVLRETSTGDDRAGMLTAEVDHTKVLVDGGTATVPPEAVTFAGQPADALTLQLQRREGRWVITDMQ